MVKGRANLHPQFAFTQHLACCGRKGEPATMMLFKKCIRRATFLVLVSTRHLSVQCRPATLAQAVLFESVKSVDAPVEFRGKHLLHLLAPLCVGKTQ